VVRFAEGVKAMANRPNDVAKRMSERRKSDGALLRETFTLPVEAARLKARGILQSGFTRRVYGGGGALATTVGRTDRIRDASFAADKLIQ
jgi:hypothetical protein